jgi:hypothetical protein
MPVAGGQIFIVPVQIEEEAGAEKIAVSLRKIGALIPVVAFDVERSLLEEEAELFRDLDRT